MDLDSELNPSELGTHEYWDKRYKAEIKNFRSHGDVGDVWFGEESMDRVFYWMNKNDKITKNSKIVDLGCGNGLFLIELANNDYKDLTGVDYSEKAIVLAKEIAEKHQAEIKYQVFDITKDNLTSFEVVHDKGTYDAISLSADAKSHREIYIDKVHNMLTAEGWFIITSCNWTEDELESQFKTHFSVAHRIPTPQFKFGGKIGSIVTSLVFQKKEDVTNSQ